MVKVRRTNYAVRSGASKTRAARTNELCGLDQCLFLSRSSNLKMKWFCVSKIEVIEISKQISSDPKVQNMILRRKIALRVISPYTCLVLGFICWGYQTESLIVLPKIKPNPSWLLIQFLIDLQFGFLTKKQLFFTEPTLSLPLFNRP